MSELKIAKIYYWQCFCGTTAERQKKEGNYIMSATDEVVPYDAESLLKEGRPVILLEGNSRDIDDFVKMVVSATGSRLDWQYSGYVAQVWHLEPNDKDGRDRIEREIEALKTYLSDQGCSILKRYPVDRYEPPAPLLSIHKVFQVTFGREE